MAELVPAPSNVIGPTWQRTTEGGFYLPERTLGLGVVNWLYEYVLCPGGKFAGEPFVPTNEQFRFILWWYAVDENGDWLYNDGTLRRLKGWGKDPLAAALSLAEMCGPVRFSHFDENGNPVGKPCHGAWIQVAAVSQDQTKNTFALFPVMVSKKLKETYGLDVNKFVIHADGGRRIESVTASPAAMEGNRPTFVIKNEVQWWGAGPDGKVNEGIAMSDVIDGNLTKTEHARALAICNAHIPGNDTVGERDYDLWADVQAGKVIDPGQLYDALEAPADTPISEIPLERDDPEGFAAGVEKLRRGVEIARGDATWMRVDQIAASILDARRDIIESRRKFLNQVNAAEDSWIAPYEWDACQPDPTKGEEPVAPLKRKDRITLGFDGSKSDDWTALVACRVDDGSLHLIHAWNPVKYPAGEVPREEVDSVVRSTFEKYDVVGFRADVFQFEAYVDQWSTSFRNKVKVNATPGNPIAFDMRGQTKQFSLDCERFVDAVLEREIRHNGDKQMRQHILNAKRHPTTYDTISIRKASKDSSRKIDIAVCCVLAFGARQDFLMSKNNRSSQVQVLGW